MVAYSEAFFYRKNYAYESPKHPANKVGVWAAPRSLAATNGIPVEVSFPPGTRMFLFPGFPSTLSCESGTPYK